MQGEMRVPSGTFFTEQDLELVRLMGIHKFVDYREEPFTLRSGIKSRVYVSGREDFTDHPELEWAVGRKIAETVMNEHEAHEDPDTTPCLIGIPVAGTALAQAASMVSFAEEITTPHGLLICHRVMREGVKEYGAHKTWVQGEPDPKHVYWTVDNTVTDGGSKIDAAEKLEQSGYDPFKMPSLVFVDRQQGGVQRMEKYGFQNIIVVFYLLDLTFALREMGLWPAGVVESVEEEIRAHQFP